MNELNEQNFLNYINKIDKVPPTDRQLTSLVQQHIAKLEKSHDEFVKTAQKEGYDMKSQNIGAVEVRMYTLMKVLSQKIGLPVEKYDEAIKTIEKRVFGEENYKRFFENNK